MGKLILEYGINFLIIQIIETKPNIGEIIIRIWRNYHMKATGIIRRIDDLGRVVVPKEIRRTLKIREGDPLEIFTDRDGEIILKKYSPIGEIKAFASQYVESIVTQSNAIVIITDRDQIIAVAGGKKEILNKEVTKEFENIIENRTVVKENTKNIKIYDGDEDKNSKIIQPIICEGDIIGSVVMVAKDENTKLSESDLKIIAIAGNFIGRQMES